MVCCCAINCRSRSSVAERVKRKLPKVSFFGLPKNGSLRQKWIDFINRKDWSPSQASKICSLHFEDKYLIKENNRIKLMSYAIPTIPTKIPPTRYSYRKRYLKPVGNDPFKPKKSKSKKVKNKQVECEIVISEENQTKNKQNNEFSFSEIPPGPFPPSAVPVHQEPAQSDMALLIVTPHCSQSDNVVFTETSNKTFKPILPKPTIEDLPLDSNLNSQLDQSIDDSRLEEILYNDTLTQNITLDSTSLISNSTLMESEPTGNYELVLTTIESDLPYNGNLNSEPIITCLNDNLIHLEKDATDKSKNKKSIDKISDECNENENTSDIDELTIDELKIKLKETKSQLINTENKLKRSEDLLKLTRKKLKALQQEKRRWIKKKETKDVTVFIVKGEQ